MKDVTLTTVPFKSDPGFPDPGFPQSFPLASRTLASRNLSLSSRPAPGRRRLGQRASGQRSTNPWAPCTFPRSPSPVATPPGYPEPLRSPGGIPVGRSARAEADERVPLAPPCLVRTRQAHVLHVAVNRKLPGVGGVSFTYHAGTSEAPLLESPVILSKRDNGHGPMIWRTHAGPVPRISTASTMYSCWDGHPRNNWSGSS